MSFFNSQEPILRLKQTHLDIQDLDGLISWRWQINQRLIMSWLYTRIDQVFLLWGWITGLIFLVPQFFPVISWIHQAMIGSGVSIMGLMLMTWLAWFWVTVERLRWLIYLWIGLVLAGLLLTDYGIWKGSGLILMNLCPLWLIICSIGYVAMGLNMRSRTFLICAIFHGVAIPLLNLAPTCQFLITALVMSGSLFLLAELQWDMRPPMTSEVLSPEQNAFNQVQQQRRRLSQLSI
ncbi:MAG: hypothetical protein F6K42_13035 [Leptolyngbya sp. SIO1D8]|nr:hypothetical protein [Leptolyngbya sp. SIO1D8]